MQKVNDKIKWFKSTQLVKKSIICLALILQGFYLSAAENIFYPDPSFEVCGESGCARTGDKAGHLKTGSKECNKDNRALMKSIIVEPFATYRFNAWVRARTGTGRALALYCYQTTSLGCWFNQHYAVLKASPEWIEVEIRIIPFTERIYVRPLLFKNAANWEAWIDDIKVEKIKSVKDTIAELKAKPTPSELDRLILARFLISKGELQKAEELTANTRPAIKADIAGLLAGQATVTGQRHLQILKMLQAGGLESPNHPKTALKKFKAVLAPCGVVEKADIFNTALRESPETEVLWDLYAEFLQQCSSSKEALTCAEQTAISDSAENLIKKVQSQQKQSKTCLEKVEKLQRVIDVVRIKLEKREKKLGHCKILLGGKLLNPRFHAIVIPNTPSEPEKYAAKELQHHFELLTSQTLPVLKDKETAGDKRSFFVIGKSRLLKDFNIDVDWEKLGKDGIFIKASGPHLFLAGGQRGALYACYTLLEDVLQVHWLSPQCTVYPKSGLFSLASIE
ncbi:MAG: hypothetical protein WC082_00160, partial [Victivallales bacterium]